MDIPLVSTLTLLAEFVVAACIFSVIYSGYRVNIFMKRLAMWTIAYEIVFNVGYMVYRSIAHPKSYTLSPLLKTVAALHGALSLAMLVAVVVFFLKASKAYGAGENYFKKQKIATGAFVFCWLVSIASGILLYLKAYVLP